MSFFSIEYYLTEFPIAEVDRLKKRESAAAAAKDGGVQEIKRPNGSIRNLQEAMGLADNKALYMNCRVSVSFIALMIELISLQATIKDVMAFAGLPCNLDWRKQNLGLISNIVTLVSISPLFIDYSFDSR